MSSTADRQACYADSLEQMQQALDTPQTTAFLLKSG